MGAGACNYVVLYRIRIQITNTLWTFFKNFASSMEIDSLFQILEFAYSSHTELSRIFFSVFKPKCFERKVKTYIVKI